MLSRLEVTLDKTTRPSLGTVVHIKIVRNDEPNDLHVQRIVPDNDFESYFDYVWAACKRILDEELKKDAK